MAYRDEANGNKTTVPRWDGSSWDAGCGQPRHFSVGGHLPELGLDAGGNPVVAYRDEFYGNKTTVMRWDGSS
ncbi:MAG: hypothetical protein U0V45_05085 [Flavobacteriales bacterium]